MKLNNVYGCNPRYPVIKAYHASTFHSVTCDSSVDYERTDSLRVDKTGKVSAATALIRDGQVCFVMAGWRKGRRYYLKACL